MLWDRRARPWPGSVRAANTHGPPGRFAVGKALPVVEVGAGRKKGGEKKKGRKKTWDAWVKRVFERSGKQICKFLVG